MDNTDPSNMKALQMLGTRIVDAEQKDDFDAVCARLVSILEEEEAQAVATDKAREAAREARNKRRRDKRAEGKGKVA
jgi:DNA polymerase III sliding clamp (beta) subunit (PCNA family)